MLRDTRKNIDYFITFLNFLNENIKKRSEKLLEKNKDLRLDMVAKNLFIDQYKKVILLYGYGDNIKNIKTEVEKLIDDWDNYNRYNLDKTRDLLSEFDSYMRVVTLISLSILLHIPQATMQKIWIDKNIRNRDLLIDTLILRYMGNSDISNNGYIYPDKFRRIDLKKLNTFDLHSIEIVLGQYLNEWYINMRGTSFYDTHLKENTTLTYIGYWAWEAAAIAACYGVVQLNDKTSFFPNDLIDNFYKNK